MAGNLISARDKVKTESDLGQVKLNAWMILLYLWYLQCQFKSINSKDGSTNKLSNEIRAFYLGRAMKISNDYGKLDFNLASLQEQDMKDLMEIYSISRNLKLEDYIGKIILDSEFQRFLKNMTKIIKKYSQKQIQNLNHYVLQVEDLIKIEYQNQYLKLKDLLGIKMNYTVIYDLKEDQFIQLKRVRKSWFRQLNNSKKVKQQKVEAKEVFEEQQSFEQIKSVRDKISIRKGTEQEIQEQREEMNKINQQIETQEQVYKIEDQSNLDKSFFSLKDDQLDKSALLDVSQIMDDKSDFQSQYEEQKQMLQDLTQKSSEVVSRQKFEMISEHDDFSRASSKDQEDLNIPYEQLFKRKNLTQRYEPPEKALMNTEQKLNILASRFEKLTESIQNITQMIWRKQIQFKYQFFYQMKLIDEINKSQEKINQEYRQRLSTMEHNQDLTTQRSIQDNEVSSQNQLTSITHTDRTLKLRKQSKRYQTPEQVQNQQRFRSFSPEEDTVQNQHQFSRLEYSPIIVDDTDQSEYAKHSDMIDENYFPKNRDTLGFKTGLDTSRFAHAQQNQMQNTEDSQQYKTQRTDLSSLTYFIDPKEHMKTLRSPIITPKKKVPRENVKPHLKQLNLTVIERSPVHFQDANKYSKLNNSKILDQIHLLGKDQRKQSVRVINQDGKASPKMLKFMLLKPDSSLMQKTYKIPVIDRQSQPEVKLLKFRNTK
ncbi:UNKNOWN [Stylonychia lemnae]|uniref:Uncharacterized protein n=1 Tax=Stylonychia lemnae TaxID=5949 RepID=A0A077ZW44_STYLE|nr:UNKNOWN [Stylonychia lemnae]|eukprot:CDW73490.1 UNKNOWN [Stylonychia lemnae]